MASGAGKENCHASQIESPAESRRRRAQRQADTPKSKLQGASKQMVDSMTEKQLEDFAKGSTKGKPEHAD